ncbi:F-box domain-containing protein [Artemisia annua]|uniref:F-box domain-containing protein n=1 Tax=Artemisia annua TaxID=35608 RepID=A0A2U1NPU7_ARTAN|nr:F-box domain-containing protein [Artemisia annua]
MTNLPSDVIVDILSRLPIKSLARFRCVSKLWCEHIDDPYFDIIHNKQRVAAEPIPIFLDSDYLNLSRIVRFQIVESKEGSILLEAKKNPFMEFECERMTSLVEGSCNGLIYISHDYVNNVHDNYVYPLVVINPLRNECFKLPPIERHLDYYWEEEMSSGLGFDDSTNTFKMVRVVYKRHLQGNNKLCNSEIPCTMVHVLGTDSWREIPQLPPCAINGEGVYAHGCLHWLVGVDGLDLQCVHTDFPYKHPHCRNVICFDVRKEEFGLIEHPKETRRGFLYYKLVDIQGEVGYVYHYSEDHSTEVWVLKQKKWIIHCQFDQKPPIPEDIIEVVGTWNKDGDILMKTHKGGDRLFVYHLKNGLLDEVNIVKDEDYKDYVYMYSPSSMVSIRGIDIKNACSI